MSLEKLVTEKAFTFEEKNDGKVFIYHYGKQVMILKGEKASRFLKRLNHGTDEEIQLALAKVTGNFKRGNEKLVNRK
ncbi:hypothetical protein M2139_000167 [Enterococcus sp. PF1-24]|uniref:hypothetical protein n=1 Tax=unclassified Enterococcus TaxID=2608891 RepID=UPI002476F2AC|nr:MULTISPECIES: hypothetical protein [unclassified Enterococcus]MDH6363192.1 hypothetical protein [Enterococcus sp. PFB1-1]MDH6400286.1 hypothetical protein [Enterococcus sp. PF1-24]